MIQKKGLMSLNKKRRALKCLFVLFACADAYRMRDIADKDLAVSDLACVGCFADRCDSAFGVFAVADNQLYLDLWDELYDILCPSVEL